MSSSSRQKSFQGWFLSIAGKWYVKHLTSGNRYHIGESMLPSMRHFLKFIDAYEKWDAHGFNVKVNDKLRIFI